jgi:hypothetical protein
MTAKEKAEKLVSDFYTINCKLIKVKNGYDMGDRYNLVMPISKQSALIAIEFAREFITGDLSESFDKTMYLFEIKQEIEKL